MNHPNNSNLFLYCSNNPINISDPEGKLGEWILGLLNPAVALAVVVVAATVIIAIAIKNKYDPDPYARPGQKKQYRENKNKNRKKKDFEPRNNRRDNMPRPPKHHTPGRDHRKFS